ncbi:ABC-type transport system involved in resistance to organic solvents, periplasmic component [Xenococcus sp. PCC 7305]|uniref:MlaD family protein n=1 Tax=Xenococcus sp. PCC 7305 TaxID=102125 RepID=UPI0002ABE2A2|nr:MlaD family protein [Xenococcus sp. PCC 7305]ELS01923.1 ABC-type transport system involved in resistance to organic solvents, periplasmic component [Xenococcus sp. PCC 7305]
MTNSSDNRMSPSMRQSIIGLMLLASLGLLGLLILWLKNFSFGNSSYQATIVFPNSGGMTTGTRVAYRGVKIGQVTTVEPTPEGVDIGVDLDVNRLIPSNARIEATQAGLVGETSIDITPLQSLPPKEKIATPLDPNCDHSIIICDGSVLQGQGKLDVNTLIRSLVRISNILGDPSTTTVFRSVIQNATNSLGDISELLESANENGGFDNLNATLLSLNQAADEVTILLQEVRETESVDNINSTLASIGGAAEDIRVFLVTNDANLATTLASITQTSDELRLTLGSMTPLIQKVEQGAIIDNFELLSANAVELTANLRDLAANLDDPQNILLLEQTLNSARSAFENIQKITSDVDELTGNPQFRQDMERLIRGLSNLTSSTQMLQQQVEYDNTLKSIASEMAKIK